MKITPIAPTSRINSKLPKPTKVIFRKTRTGEIIALFPEIPGTDRWMADCMSYLHTGQHSPASIDVHAYTKSCNQEDARHLVKELTALGYRLEIVHRFQAHHLTARKRAVEETRGASVDIYA